MNSLEFFYDLTSPWTYLAYTGIQEVIDRHAVDVSWRPILVGGVFNAVNQDLYSRREAALGNRRMREHMLKDLADWARLRGIEINWPRFHPASAVQCMRGCFIAEASDRLHEYIRAVFEAYWGRCEDISDAAVLADVAAGAGLDRDGFLSGLQQQEVKDRLRANTDELIERGGFGSPTLFVNRQDMYFGNDRLPLVEAALKNLN